MKNLNYLPIHKITDRFTDQIGDIHLRAYVSSGFPDPQAAQDFLSLAIRGDRYKEITQAGLLGVAFLYGFVPERGEGTTKGLDLAIYRSKKATAKPLTLEINDSLMIHTWTLELPEGKKEFQSLDRSREGTLCIVESVILGRESEKILDALNRNRQTGKPFSPARYLENPSNLPNIKEFE